MNSMKFSMNKKGISEVIGTVLLLAIAVSAFSVLAVYVFSNNGTTPTPHVNLVGYMDKNYNAIIEHQGGDSLKLENVRLIIWLGEVKSNEFTFPKSMLQNYNHSIFFPSKGNSMFYDAGNNRRWDVGDYIKIDCPSIFSDITQNISHWQISVTVIDKASNSIIMSGILQQGILHTVPPVAMFTYEPLNPKVGRGVIFNASASYDPDGGEIKEYIWNFDDNTSPEIKYDYNATHQYSRAGVYHVTLTVIDDDGEQSSITAGIGVGSSIPPINVTVNKPPVAYFTNITQGDGWVYFDASKSYDPDGTVVKYSWDFGDGHTQIKLYDPTIKWQYAKGGRTYNVSLVVEDNDGATSSKVSSYTLYHTLLYVPPIPPVVIIKTPADISTASDAFFSGIDSYDPDGDDLVNFSWDFDGDGNPDAYGVNVTYHFYQVGNYTINLTVVDSSGGVGYATRTIYVRAPIAARRFLIVDNTPHDRIYQGRKFDGISNILKSLNIGDVYDYAKAIDQTTFYAYHNDTGWYNNSVPILSTILDKYDIVIWSTGNFPGDGGNNPNDPDGSNPNYWTTPMTEGWPPNGDDHSDHTGEMASHLQHNGTLLLCGAYAVRDLQGYPGNGVTQSEVNLGESLGLYYRDDTVAGWWDSIDDHNGGINESLHKDETGYYTDGETFEYGPIYAQGVLQGLPGTSADNVTLRIEQPMPLYSLVKQPSSDFQYSLQSIAGETALDEGFESGSIPPGWRVYNPEGDYYEWYVSSNNPHTGNYCIRSPGADDDWIVTPQITVPSHGIFQFWAMDPYGNQPFMVWLSTTGNTISDLENGILLGSGKMSSSYTLYTYDLSEYAGQKVYLAIHATATGYSDPHVDDIKVTSNGIPSGYYAIDAVRGKNRSIVLGFDLNSPAINDTDRENYIIHVVNWLAEAVGYPTKIYVDNNKPQSWYDDTHVGDIQDAIDRVMVGGTIYVNGTDIPYTSFTVTKSVNIIGVNVGNGYPVVKANGEYAVKIGVDWATIKNLKIEGMGNLEKGIYLDGSSSSSIINCNISHATYGIYAVSSNYLNIRNDEIFYNTYSIYMQKCVKGEIENNTIYSADYGIYAINSPKLLIKINEICYNDEKAVYLDSSDKTTIQNNSIYKNGIAIYASYSGSLVLYKNSIFNNSVGIYLDQSTNVQVYENYIKNATQTGIFIANYSNGGSIFGNVIRQNGDGIKIANSNYITIYNNTIFDNVNNIKIDKGNNNIVIRNNIKNASYGIYSSSSISNQLYNNTIWNCSNGIYGDAVMDSQIRGNIINSSDNAITLCNSHPSNGNNSIALNLIYNCDYGIVLSSQSDGNKIINNTISNITNWGIGIQSFSTLNKIENNSIMGTPYGIYVKSSSYNTISFNDIISPTVAIYLSSADNNKLLNNSIVANYYGIYIISGSNKNDIINSTVHDCLYGIYIYSSYSTMVLRNLIINSTDGILLENSDAETIINNTIANNTNGIHLISSGGSGNTIKFNRIYNNTHYGIILENSKASTAGNNEITGNNIHDNGEDGIYLYSSNINSISQNEIYNNGNNGICIYSSNSNPITMNEVHDNGNNGIFANNSDSNIIDSNTIYYNAKNGIYLSSSDGNRIGNNTMFNNTIGMYLYASSEGDQYKIEGNEIWNNSIGIFLNASDSNYFGYDTANQIYNNTYGIYLISSPGNHFVGNAIFNNSYGICIIYSSNIEISKNYVGNNTIGVYINSSSSNNIITQNNFIISTGYGVYINGSNCKNNLIYYNNFINITAIIDSLGYDDSSGNNWYNVNSNDKEGNYWGNYKQRYPTATELPPDNPWYYSENYEIDGNAGSADIRPLINEVT